MEADQQNVNQWTLRLVEDEEVDYDFPALNRTKPVVQFTTANILRSIDVADAPIRLGRLIDKVISDTDGASIL